MSPFDDAVLSKPYNDEDLRRVIVALPCAWCGDKASSEVVNNSWSDAHGFPLCIDCRSRFERIRGEKSRRDFAFDLNTKTLHRLIVTGRLIVAKEG